MLTRYWSLSQQGHLQPHSKSKAWQLSTRLSVGLLALLLQQEDQGNLWILLLYPLSHRIVAHSFLKLFTQKAGRHYSWNMW